VTRPPRATGAGSADGASALDSTRPPDTTSVTRYLLGLVARCDDGEVPLVDQLTEADLGTPRGTASIARAALSVLRSKDPAVVRADLERELAENNWLAVWRLRRLSGDLSEAADWSAVASRTPIDELQRLRRYGTEVA
jgi:hypothetical protein